MSRLPQERPETGPPADPAIASWTAALASKERREREAARLALVSRGTEALDALVECLADGRHHVRWEAAKALADLADARAAPALVRLLEDEESGIRWLAAEGLIALECDGLPALLGALEHGHSQRLREGAHHVLRELRIWKLVRMLGPVMDALEEPAAHARVPVAAAAARDVLRAPS